ncbi:hypothetical protein [Rhizobium wuzhouense]|uniref:hypothetical protein n=1 Tax=Rhizobium wuzhouense TaxID=1986026 RepID=UPI001FE0C565|nr:hypothetical protein [Rhizobium wuzhouense]
MIRRARLPSMQLWSVGALAWGLAMALSFLLSIHVFGRATGSHDIGLTAIYAAGGVIGWLVALPLVCFSGDGRRSAKIFAAWFLLLGLATIGATAGLFALQYRMFYAHWHAPFPSRIWVYQFVFTSASALYQFAVLGLRHFLPTAFLILLVLAILMARRNR